MCKVDDGFKVFHFVTEPFKSTHMKFKNRTWILITGAVLVFFLVSFLREPSDSQKIETLIKSSVITQEVSSLQGFGDFIPEVTIIIGGHLWRKDVIFGGWTPEYHPVRARRALCAFYKQHTDSS